MAPSWHVLSARGGLSGRPDAADALHAQCAQAEDASRIRTGTALQMVAASRCAGPV
jgi:hypothetical protein